MKTKKQLQITTMIKPIYTLLLAFGIALTFSSCDDGGDSPDPCEGFDIEASRSDENEITINFTEGTAPYSYVIAYTGLDATQEGTATGASVVIDADEYAAASITVTDANDCEATTTVVAGNPCNDSDLAATVEREFDEADMLSIEITGGEAPYTYAITFEGSDTTQTGESEATTFEVEAADFATATVSITDNIGCLENVTVDASECNGFEVMAERNTEGQIEFSITGGSSPYGYSIAYDGISRTPQSGSFDNQEQVVPAEEPNAAEITVSDANGCEIVVTIDEDPCDGFTAMATGENNAISVTITAGTAPYSYSVAYADTNTPQTGSSDDREFDIEVNTAGKAATVTITDASGCEVVTNEVSAYDISSFIDTRDGNRYSIGEYNGLTWMTENYRGSYTDYKCYDDNTTNCTNYGGLYTWAMATSDDIAPEGWRLPTRAEVESMLESIEGDQAADATALLGGGSTNLDFILSGRYFPDQDEFYGLEGSPNGDVEGGYYWTDYSRDEDNGYLLRVISRSATSTFTFKTDYQSIRFVKE